MEDKKNLIVNYLPNSLTQDDVKKLFEDIGPIASCKLIRNKTTGQSMGYGFVEYVDESHAERAITELTGLEMEGKRLKVSYAGGGGGSGGAGMSGGGGGEKNNVYVANLPSSITEERLLELFSDHGTIVSSRLLTNADGSSRGAGFVRFSTSAEAANAIKALAGCSLAGSVQPLTVKLALPPAAKNSQSLNSFTNNTLAGVGVASRSINQRYNPIGTLPQAISNQAALGLGVSPVAAALSGMQAHLAQHGSSLVAAATQQVAQQVTHNAYNQIATTQRATTQQVQSMASVYVFGLQPTHSELTLYELFSPFGAIINVKMIRDLSREDKPGKGYGFVNFTKMEDALLAIASMNGVPFEEKILQVSLKQNKGQNNTMALGGVAPLQQQQLPTAINPVMNPAITILGSNYAS